MNVYTYECVYLISMHACIYVINVYECIHFINIYECMYVINLSKFVLTDVLESFDATNKYIYQQISIRICMQQNKYIYEYTYHIRVIYRSNLGKFVLPDESMHIRIYLHTYEYVYIYFSKLVYIKKYA